MEFSNDDFLAHLDEFEALYKERPVKGNFGGTHSPHLFYLWYMLKKLQPSVVIESGIWRGQSTWLIEQAVPDAVIHSFDIRHDLIEYHGKNVNYYNHDVTQCEVEDWPEDTFAFWDDHVDPVRRLDWCADSGIHHMIFDDNYPNGNNPKLDKERNGLMSLKRYYDKAQGFFGVFPINLEIITVNEFPPIFADTVNRWGEPWDSHETKPPLKAQGDNSIYFKERKDYTWPVYVRI